MPIIREITRDIPKSPIKVVIGDMFGPNLVTNGSFDTSVAGWTNNSTAPATLTWDATAKALKLTTTTGTARTETQCTGLVIGARYQLDLDISSSANIQLLVGSTSGGNQMYQNGAVGAGKKTITFQATATTAYLRFNLFAQNQSVLVDNVMMRRIM